MLWFVLNLKFENVIINNVIFRTDKIKKVLFVIFDKDGIFICFYVMWIFWVKKIVVKYVFIYFIVIL